MNRLRTAALAATLCLLIAPSARADFADVVRAVEARAGGHKTPIPLFGLVRLAVWIAHPDGVHDIEIATWEGKHSIPAEEIAPLLRARAGADYQPMIVSRSKRGGDWTFIYARPRSERLLEIIMVNHDNEDTVVMRAVVEPRVLSGEIAGRSHHHGMAFARK